MAVSKKQLAWGYMRRNRTFHVGDLLMIIPMSNTMIRRVISGLVNQNLLRKENKSREMKERIYTLIEDRGAKCPI